MISGNLFTRDYLLDGIDRTPQWKGISDSQVEASRLKLCALAKTFLKIAKPNEAETEREFIYPVIEALGWTDYQVQQILSQKGRKQVPDALLFPNSDSKTLAVAEAQQWKRFQHGSAVLEAKRWGRALDRADKRDPSEEGVPSTQMLQYLSRVDVQTNNKVRLGILTNGNVWRLYFQGALSVSEDYFEIDLAKALELPGHDLTLLDRADSRLDSDRAVRLFILLFGKAAFLPIEGQRTFHDLAREAGKTWEEQVTKDLSELVFGQLFPKLVGALAKHDPARPAHLDAAYLDDVRQNALILLYRLLFVVYAEDRDLLPDQREPYKSYSLTTMRLDIADRVASKQVFSGSAATYWPKLTAVFKAIAEGDDDLGIPPYNGGLFATQGAQLLKRVELPDSIVSALIFGLSHREEEGSPRYINYRDLSVQQLGTIYERTLEYGLKFENGAVVVSADDAARHESGSYYTPDSLVSLIIEKAVGPFIEERLAAFRDRSEALASDKRSVEIRLAELQGLDPASHILELRICDPAMGSGHFLVSLVDWLADRALAAIAEAEAVVDWSELPYKSPVLNNIEATRQDIIKQATKHGWPFAIEHLDDRHIVRRTILKRCIYGVDLNPMAVELTKVALWLHTFTVGAPLSFLDHHLRCGNSLFGSWISGAADRLTKWGGRLLINEPMRKAVAQATAMQKLERVTDADIAEVFESKTLFEGIEQETKPFDTFLKVLYALDWQDLKREDEAAIRAWLDGQFGDPFDIVRGKLLLGAGDVGAAHPEARDAMERIAETARPLATRFAKILNQARDDIKALRFQNWQVAFPGVWRQWESKELIGGFHAVIGNPPYVRHELLGSTKPALKRAFSAYDGYADLYVYFYEQGLKLLMPGGRLSYVVTNKWLRAGYAEGLRGLFADSAWVEFVADFGHAKKFFPDADVFPSVIVTRKPTASLPAPSETTVCAIPRDDVPEKNLEEAVSAASYSLPRTHFTSDNWIIEPPAVVALYNKIRGTGKGLSDVIGSAPMYGVKTGFNEAFLIDTPTRNRLVAEHASADNIIRPYLRGQDVGRWNILDTGLWMIFARRGVDIDSYPSVKRHLESFRTRLEPKPNGWKPSRPGEKWPGRKAGTYAWYELQDAVDYWEEFGRPKIIYKVIQYYPSYAFDSEGRLGNDKTFIIPTNDLTLLAILNSPLMWWFNWRHLTHLKDEALSPMGYKMERLPIADFAAVAKKQVTRLVEQVTEETVVVRAAADAIADWLKHTLDIAKPSRAIFNIDAMSPDTFISLVQGAIPRRRRLTAADISELKREYDTTIEPAREARRRIFALEQRLSDLVNAAYGLTAQEVALMWKSAPPRMPLTPLGLAMEETADDLDGDDD